jgi:hypothetical protein
MVFVHRFVLATETTTAATQQQAPENQNNHLNNLPDSKWIWAACLFLACKAEEEPRRLRDVINLAHMLENNNDDSKKDNNVSPGNNNLIISMASSPPSLDNNYWDSKKVIVTAEQSVLRWLGFDTTVMHPHRTVRLLLLSQLQSSNSEQQQNPLEPIAFRRLNDALFYTPALTHTCLELACAAIQLAFEEYHKQEKKGSVVDAKLSLWRGPVSWWERYGISKSGMERTIKDLEKATDYLRRSQESLLSSQEHQHDKE